MLLATETTMKFTCGNSHTSAPVRIVNPPQTILIPSYRLKFIEWTNLMLSLDKIGEVMGAVDQFGFWTKKYS